MSTESIPLRNKGQVIDAGWFNLLKNVLIQVVVGRSIDGIALTDFATLGRSSYKWLAAHVMEMRFMKAGGSKYGGITAPSGMSADYIVKLPTALPVSGNGVVQVTSAGQMQIIVPDTSLDSETGPNFMVKDQGVTRAHLGSVGQVITSLGSVSGYTSSTYTNIGTAPSITTVGRPIFVGAYHQFTNSIAGSQNTSGPGTSLRFKRDGTVIATLYCTETRVDSNAFFHIDTPAAGSYVYSVEVCSPNNTTPITMSISMLVFEYS